ncbi:MAG TPA: efflux RND transporter periplasmic adaptor subunit [Pyrinomonadaceae bacterium]|jgi:cobalt-zinc-cadmium efflux system membrane fusion protein|nr:efflux RND transporter periplasmic adaptor subunit [Pyrinomonadaceae bacterium]
MFPNDVRRILTTTLLLLSAFCCGCSRSNTSGPATAANTQATLTESGPNSGVELEIVAMQPIEGSLVVSGKILAMEDKTASLGPVHEGRIVNFYAGQGSVVRKGQKLAELESADIDQAEADYLKALADLENANRISVAEIKFNQATYDRTKLLVEKEITPAKNLQQAEHDLDVAKANGTNTIASAKVAVSNARRHLLILGLTDAAVNSLASKQNLGASVFPLFAPISGTVIERAGSIGATVGSDASVFKIVDLSSVWIDANVFEKDLDRIRMGEAVKVTVPASGGSSFMGRVILISSVVDPETRTVKVRTQVPNPGGMLKPDMFANVEIITAARTTAVTIPLAAVLDDGGKSVIFVADGSEFKKREVTLGLKSDDRVEVVQGLNVGDKVVVKGNYLLMEQSKGGE